MTIISKTIEFGPDNGLHVLVISGVHGNETHAVTAVYEFFKEEKYLQLDFINQITFIFNLNEYGLVSDTRDNNYNPEISKNCNRLFPTKYETSKQIKEYIEKLGTNFDLVLDVHNSPYCIPCALIDYDQNTYRLLEVLKGVEVIPLVRATQIGTLKKYFNKYGRAYTIELPEMGVRGNIEESKDLIGQFIKIVTTNIGKNNYCQVPPLQDILSHSLYTHTDHGIISYNRKENITGRYKKDELICQVHSLLNDYVEEVLAPYDGILYDIDSNLYSYAAKIFGIYGKEIVLR